MEDLNWDNETRERRRKEEGRQVGYADADYG